MSRARRAAWLPTEGQELLLRAGLEDGGDALAAWREWTRRKGTQDADASDLQILPLVSRNISHLDPADGDLGRLQGISRYIWVKNQLLMDMGADVLSRLSREGIETMVLKGAALSVLAYRDLGARPMLDLDVLVRPAAARDAIAVLRRDLEPHENFPNPEAMVHVHPSNGFVDGSGREVDLHWYSLWQSSPDDDFWEASVPIEIAGAPSRALAPADQLLHVCAHGARWHPVTALRWIADAITVMRVYTDLDWRRFHQQALKRELSPILADALDYLSATFATPIPPSLVDELRRTRGTPTQRLERHAARRPSTITGVLSWHWDRYRRLKRLDPNAPRASSFANQIKTSAGHDTYRGLLGYGIARVAHRARRVLTGRDDGTAPMVVIPSVGSGPDGEGRDP